MGLELRLFDARVVVESPSVDFIAGLSRCFEAGRTTHRRGEPELVVRVEAERAADGRPTGFHGVTTTPPGALAAPWDRSLRHPIDLVSALTRWAAERPRGCFVFHAACVALGDCALLLPGCSQAGKSTLAAHLLRHDFELLSDELGALDLGSLEAHGYARHLALRSDVLALFGLPPDAGFGMPGDPSRFVDPWRIGGRRVRGRPRLGWVVAPRYVPGATAAARRPDPAESVALLIECACSLPCLGAEGLDWLIGLERRVPVWCLEYGDLEAARLAILERMLPRSSTP